MWAPAPKVARISKWTDFDGGVDVRRERGRPRRTIKRDMVGANQQQTHRSTRRKLLRKGEADQVRVNKVAEP